MRRFLILIVLIFTAASSAAQDAYPSKARIITPAAPGTSPDLLSRVIAQHLAPRLGQQVVVVNQPAIVERLNREINAVLKDPEASSALVKLGFTPVGGTAADFRKLIADGIEKWGKVVRGAGIKPE